MLISLTGYTCWKEVLWMSTSVFACLKSMHGTCTVCFEEHQSSAGCGRCKFHFILECFYFITFQARDIGQGNAAVVRTGVRQTDISSAESQKGIKGAALPFHFKREIRLCAK